MDRERGYGKTQMKRKEDEMVNGWGNTVRMLFYHAGAVAILLTLLSCAVTPRVSSWQSPQRFTQKDVFNAALQAGSDEGMQLAGSDRDAGTMSFRRKSGKGEMVLNVTVKDVGGIVQVRTTASYGGNLAIHGLHEEYIHNFHVFLFRNLGISSASEQHINIEEST